MTREEKIESFDINGPGQKNDGIYGLPFTLEESETVLIPVPWEVTVSSRSGTAEGPEAILNASYQVDLFDPVVPDAWKKGIYMEPVDASLKSRSAQLRLIAERIIQRLTEGAESSGKIFGDDREKIRNVFLQLTEQIKIRAVELLKAGKVAGLVGGDHSTPLGLMQATAEIYGSFGILQIDAHADLRNAYEGFEFSHASIMYNALKIESISRLVQVGIRDYCEEELIQISKSNGRIVTFFDRDIKSALYNGDSWDRICNRINAALPDNIYLSFDIDGLDPKLCPNTGTPVAGGFETEQVLFLLEKIVKSGKRIVAFDLNEVSPGSGGDSIDANVAARLLYRICNLAAFSNRK